MRFSTFFAAALTLGVACAEVINVNVGENGTLAFNPAEVTAQNGDTIAFTFLSKNHTVTQSTFASPCTNFSDTGLDSGFQFVQPNATSFMQYSFNMTNVTGPLWFYCRQAGHCAKGMVFAVNPTAEKSFAMFQANAMGTANATTGANGTTTTGSNGTTGSSSPSGATPSGAGQTGAPTTNGAVSARTGGALLLSGVGLVAGLLL
ncbi:cupredoxin domain-containing protein [Phanerochaete sordida]|uniref:Cupredoxin domain-containing protein n=1 Tax=Phanerochaete sordida TaxID=48140 RepID=A0A9P3LM90_9APHY|nr:cupredoxin domain-containing protein [Phanerochaete sordida]